MGLPIRVRADVLGAPLSFTWEERRHEVAQITRRWRVDERWWRGRVWREYFKLATKGRLLAVIYHDLIGGGWYLQRVFD
jgi:hypothetical protein